MRVGTINIEEIYLFTGKEEVRKKVKIKRILNQLNEKKTSVVQYDLDNVLIQDVVCDCMTIPFLSDYKVVMVKNPRFLTKQRVSTRHDNNAFIQYLKNPVSTTVLIIDATNMDLDNNNDVVKTLYKTAYEINNKELDDIEYKAWIKRSFSIENIEIREDALNTLIEYVKDNSVKMEQEIEKLINYAGSQKKITEDDVLKIVCPDLEDNIFNLTKALILKDRTKVMNLFYDFESSTQDLLGMLGLIAKTINELLLVNKLLIKGFNQAMIAESLKIKSGRAYYLVKDAKVFKTENLAEAIKKMAQLDYMIKTGQIDKNLGMELLLLEL